MPPALVLYFRNLFLLRTRAKDEFSVFNCFLSGRHGAARETGSRSVTMPTCIFCCRVYVILHRYGMFATLRTLFIITHIRLEEETTKMYSW